MTNWLERAKLQISQNTDHDTANTDKRNLTAVTAVGILEHPEISHVSIGSNDSTPPTVLNKTEFVVPMTANESAMIKTWLASINETDSSIIAHVLN